MNAESAYKLGLAILVGTTIDRNVLIEAYTLFKIAYGISNKQEYFTCAKNMERLLNEIEIQSATKDSETRLKQMTGTNSNIEPIK